MRGLGSKRLSRRTLLRSLVVALGLIGGRRPAQTRSVSSWPTDAERLYALLASCFGDASHAVTVGQRCLSHQAPAEALARTRTLLAADGATSQSARERLAQQRRADFALGKTAIADGWVLARCEADVCVSLAQLSRS